MNEPRLPWTRISPESYQAMAATSGPSRNPRSVRC
jgi:hypothetical protein